jgi:hypothetical protein
MSDRLARHPVNDAYERGWREGWAACLSRVEELGLEVVLKRERDIYERFGFATPLTLCFEKRASGEGDQDTAG